MKKKILSAAVVAAALLIGYSAYDAQRSLGMNDTLLANVEALASNSGEATKTEVCYLELRYSKYNEPKIFCDENTNKEYIYSCPESHSGYYDDKATNRCTKD